MSDAQAWHQPGEAIDVERLLGDALRPIEPPERLSGRLEETFASITQAAADELSDWAEELSEGRAARRCATRATGCGRWSR